jgi:DNA transposition AAA+ family ATPase
MEKIKKKIKPVFIKTKNVNKFVSMMNGLKLSEGEGRMAVASGTAGRGKTRTAIWYQAKHPCIFLRALNIWKRSDIPFLQALCREYGILNAPYRRDRCFMMLLDVLLTSEKAPKIIIIDEIEKLPFDYVETLRDLADMTGVCIVMIGEDELVSHMQRSKRVWSRVFQTVKFQPIESADIIVYAREAAGLAFTPEIAAMFRKASEGDFRIVKRDLFNLIQNVNAASAEKITPEMVKIAINTGLSGR